MNKRKIIFAIVIGILGLAACSGRGDDTQVSENAYDAWEADSASFRIAVMPTLDCLPLFVAEGEGMFERQGVSVSLYPYQAQMDCDTALMGGWVDAMATDLVRAEHLKTQGMKLRYLTATDLQWQLLAGNHTRIKRLGQLENKMIAMTRYSATAMLADELVDSASVINEHVFRIQVNDVNVRLQMLKTEVMDALLLPEPQATAARQMGAMVLYDTRWNKVNMGVLVAKETALSDTLGQHQADCILKAYSEACDSINHRGIRHYAKYIGVKDVVNDSLLQEFRFSGVHAPSQTDINKATMWLNK